ncbi:MAG: hypothetical protein LRZ94_00820 [Candidatus Pacebacteria bacterium]|nr:hypothetical protein [Candidatus Paceibacterota bacterium]
MKIKNRRKFRIQKYQREAAQLKKRAEHLKSPKGLVIETFKGILQTPREIKKRIRWHLAGGEYGERMEKRGMATPEGRAMRKNLRIEGFWKTLKKYRKKKK